MCHVSEVVEAVHRALSSRFVRFLPSPPISVPKCYMISIHYSFSEGKSLIYEYRPDQSLQRPSHVDAAALVSNGQPTSDQERKVIPCLNE